MTATLTISSRNYSSWSLRGWLICRMAGLDFEIEQVPEDDPDTRNELLLMSPSFLVPRLTHGAVRAWAPLAIAEYLNEINPASGLLPADPVARSHCRSISAEMSAGFANLRSALPMNLRARHESFPVFSGARPDIERILAIWAECLETSTGPWLYGNAPTLADAMYAPVCTRFRTYGIELHDQHEQYCSTVMEWPLIAEWTEAASEAEIPELEMEF